MTSVELEAFRRLLFFSVPEAAATLGGVSEQAWRRWEAGTRPVPADIAKLVKEILQYRGFCLGLRSDVAASPLRPFPLLWYSSREDWVAFGGPHSASRWRAYQSACAALASEFGDRVLLVPFDADAYAVWLAGREDSVYARNDWAAHQASGGG